MNIQYNIRISKGRANLLAIDHLVKEYHGGATQALTAMLINEKERIIRENPNLLPKWVMIESEFEDSFKEINKLTNPPKVVV